MCEIWNILKPFSLIIHQLRRELKLASQENKTQSWIADIQEEIGKLVRRSTTVTNLEMILLEMVCITYIYKNVCVCVCVCVPS